jgi:hypothetical protein
VQQTVKDAIADLTPRQRQKLRARLSGWHLICGVLVMVVQALEPFAEADQQIAEALAPLARPHRRGLAEMVTAKVLKKLITRFIQVVGQAAFAKAKAVLKLLRICAIVICPDPEQHPEIRLHCIDPLVGEAVNAAAISQLTRMQLAPINGFP